MGTSESGRYLNTQGSKRKVSDFALVHSSEGKFTRPSHPRDRLRLVSGGHGEANIKLLEKHKIKYNIVKTYENGVRIGNIPDHRNPSKRTGTGQTWFPRTWTEKDIRRAGQHVAGLKQNRHTRDGTTMHGVYKGVLVGVIKTNGRIATIFPDANQTSVLKKRRK